MFNEKIVERYFAHSHTWRSCNAKMSILCELYCVLVISRAEKVQFVHLRVQSKLPTSIVPVAFPTDTVYRFRYADPSSIQNGFVTIVTRQHQTDRERQVQGRRIGFSVNIHTDYSVSIQSQFHMGTF